jgi:hypothetical protein
MEISFGNLGMRVLSASDEMMGLVVGFPFY